MNYEKMEAGPEMDYLIGIKLMGFTEGRYYKNGGGTYPADAKKVRHGKTAWDAHSEGGTYPFLLKSGTIFWKERGFGDNWQPSKNIAQAWYVLETLDILRGMDLDKVGTSYRLCHYTKEGVRLPFVLAPTAALTICRAALMKWAAKKSKVRAS